MDIKERKFLRSVLAATALAVGMGGCSSPMQVLRPAAERIGLSPAEEVQGTLDLVRVGYSIADALVAELRRGHPDIDPDVPILVTSFVNRTNLDASSELGLLMADHVSSRLTQQGFTVVEPRLRQDLSIRSEEGEFILSRDVARLSQETGAYAVVVGSYTELGDTVSMTTKIVEILDRKTLASVDVKLPADARFPDLLLKTGRGTTLEVVAQ